MGFENPFKVSPEVKFPPEETEKNEKEWNDEFKKSAREKGHIDYIGKSGGVTRETLNPDESYEDAVARAKKNDESWASEQELKK